MSKSAEVIEVDVGKKDAAKPAIAARLEADAKKRQSLTKEDVEGKLKEAEERRQVSSMQTHTKKAPTRGDESNQSARISCTWIRV
jgi:hypothetical protein